MRYEAFSRAYDETLSNAFTQKRNYFTGYRKEKARIENGIFMNKYFDRSELGKLYKPLPPAVQARKDLIDSLKPLLEFDYVKRRRQLPARGLPYRVSAVLIQLYNAADQIYTDTLLTHKTSVVIDVVRRAPEWRDRVLFSVNRITVEPGYYPPFSKGQPDLAKFSGRRPTINVAESVKCYLKKNGLFKRSNYIQRRE
jgi:hypothetical protein